MNRPQDRVESNADRAKPESLRELFVFFSLLALQGFGGIVAFIERGLVVQKKWMTREEFLEDWAVARTMPGPPAINMSIVIGARHFGVIGSIVSVAGMFLVPTGVVLVLAVLYAQFNDQPQVVDALRGMGSVAAGLIIATGLRLLTALRSNVMGLTVCAVLAVASFVLVALLEWRVMYVLLMLGIVACGYAYWCIRTRDRSA
jgi:chromate transporter